MPYIRPSGYGYPHAPLLPVPGHGGDRLAALPPALPGFATTAHGVSLAEFCAAYKISEGDGIKLGRLGHRPGDRNVERLDEKDWCEFATFTRLGWESFLSAHHAFCAAVGSRYV